MVRETDSGPAQRRRRILLVHPSAELYGSDRALLESAAAYVTAGWQVTVSLPADGPLTAALADAGAHVIVSPTVVLRKAYLHPVGILRLAALAVRSAGPSWTMIRRLQPDVIYVNTVTLPLWLVLGRVARVKVIAHVHEAEEDVPKLVRIALAAPMLLAHVILVNSKASIAVLTTALPALRDRTALLYNGVPGPEVVAPLRETLTDPVRIVLVGRLSPRKGTDVALEALARLRDSGRPATLDLVGSVFPGYEWYEAELHERVRTLQLEESVTFHGFSDSVWKAYEQADIAMVPSRVEPFGNASVEAQLAGRPVVISSTQGLVETLDSTVPAAARVVAPGDPRALADAVQQLAEGWAAARRDADRARIRAADRFDPQLYAADLIAVTIGLVGEVAAHRRVR